MLIVITDDQPWDTLPRAGGPPAMPWLESRLADPADRWVRFTNAFLNVPLCCPSRASILTGRYARHTGVEDNGDGADFDESATLATWFDDAGYQTAFLGKYLNGYPWGRGPHVPAGWDRFLAKRNLDLSTTYAGYPFVDQGVPFTAGTSERAYATSLLADEASTFLRGASRDRPWFLVYAPDRAARTLDPRPAGCRVVRRRRRGRAEPRALNDVRQAGLGPSAPRDRGSRGRCPGRGPSEHAGDARSGRPGAPFARGRGAGQRELEHTIVIFPLRQRLLLRRAPLGGQALPLRRVCSTPLVVRSPLDRRPRGDHPVSNVDLAPTILDLAGLGVPARIDGRSVRPVLDDRTGRGVARRGVDRVGGRRRGARMAWCAHGGVRLRGAYGRARWSSTTSRGASARRIRRSWNRADDPAYAAIRRELALTLMELVEGAPLRPQA